MTAATDLIERSVDTNEIIHACTATDIREELLSLCADHVDSGDTEEFWGADAAGNTWRVHLAAQAYDDGEPWGAGGRDVCLDCGGTGAVDHDPADGGGSMQACHCVSDR